MNNETSKGAEYVGSEAVYAEVERTRQLMAEFNSGWHTDEEGRQRLAEITRKPVGDGARVFAPMHLNYGPGLTLGRECFINFGCTMLALGSIVVEEGAFIGPHCVLATEYHPEDPARRHSLLTKPITIGRNAWLGAGVTVLAGVTIGQDAIVAAGSVVTKDVPDGMVAAGTPARVIRPIRGAHEEQPESGLE